MFLRHHKIHKYVQAMLKQEMGWYDREKNNTGALCARLSTSAEVIYLMFIFGIISFFPLKFTP